MTIITRPVEWADSKSRHGGASAFVGGHDLGVRREMVSAGVADRFRWVWVARFDGKAVGPYETEEAAREGAVDFAEELFAALPCFLVGLETFPYRGPDGRVAPAVFTAPIFARDKREAKALGLAYLRRTARAILGFPPAEAAVAVREVSI